ncbi:hypothetical protein LINPERHAP2_LOCUS21165 [Linum perenne]
MSSIIVKAIMSSFFPCHPKILFLHNWPIMWFDDLSNHLDSIKNGQMDVNQIADFDGMEGFEKKQLFMG